MRKLLIAGLVIVSCSAAFGESPPPSPAELQHYVDQRICPGSNTTYTPLGYSDRCGHAPWNAKCMKEVNAENVSINAYNKWIQQCHRGGSPQKSTPQPAPARGASPSTSSSPPQANSSPALDGFCDDLQLIDTQFECKRKCNERPAECKRENWRGDQFKKPSGGGLGGLLQRKLDEQNNKAKDADKMNARSLQDAKRHIERGNEETKYLEDKQRREEEEYRTQVENDRRRRAEEAQRRAEEARRRPSSPAPASRPRNGCPPGMVHDPRINPNECIRL